MFSEGPGGCASLVHSLLNRAVGAPPEALRQVDLSAPRSAALHGHACHLRAWLTNFAYVHA